MFYVKSVPDDLQVIEDWLQSLGEMAKALNDIRVVYRKKQHRRAVEIDLIRIMRIVGVRLDENVVEVARLEWLHCVCERCVYRHIYNTWKASDVVCEGRLNLDR